MHHRTSGLFEEILTQKEKATLWGEVFRNREIVGVDLSGSDLRGARFERTRLAECNLARADLRGAHFVQCELRGVDLTDALLVESRFDGTTLDEFAMITTEARLHIERAGGTFGHVHASSR